jgi:hypothetical protein
VPKMLQNMSVEGLNQHARSVLNHFKLSPAELAPMTFTLLFSLLTHYTMSLDTVEGNTQYAKSSLHGWVVCGTVVRTYACAQKFIRCT